MQVDHDSFVGLIIVCILDISYTRLDVLHLLLIGLIAILVSFMILWHKRRVNRITFTAQMH